MTQNCLSAALQRRPLHFGRVVSDRIGMALGVAVGLLAEPSMRARSGAKITGLAGPAEAWSARWGATRHAATPLRWPMVTGGGAASPLGCSPCVRAPGERSFGRCGTAGPAC